MVVSETGEGRELPAGWLLECETGFCSYTRGATLLRLEGRLTDSRVWG